MRKPLSPIEEKKKRTKRYKTDQHLHICGLESDLATARERLQFYSFSMRLLKKHLDLTF